MSYRYRPDEALPSRSETLICWHGAVARHYPPPVEYYAYLLHFQRRYFHAGHYLGATACLDARITLHQTGRGAKLLKAVVAAGITFELVRLWKGASWQEVHDIERTLKKRHDGPGLCPVCRREKVDVLVALRQGHWPFSLFAPSRRRQPVNLSSPCFVSVLPQEADS